MFLEWLGQFIDTFHLQHVRYYIMSLKLAELTYARISSRSSYSCVRVCVCVCVCMCACVIHLFRIHNETGRVYMYTEVQSHLHHFQLDHIAWIMLWVQISYNHELCFLGSAAGNSGSLRRGSHQLKLVRRRRAGEAGACGLHRWRDGVKEKLKRRRCMELDIVALEEKCITNLMKRHDADLVLMELQYTGMLSVILTLSDIPEFNGSIFVSAGK